MNNHLAQTEWKPSITAGRMSAQRLWRGAIRTYSQRGTFGVIRRMKDGREERERCEHAHRTHAGAQRCADKRWQRSTTPLTPAM